MRIPEALHHDLSAPWAEIECLQGPLDVSGLQASLFDGVKDAVVSDSPLTLGTGEFLVLRWGTPGVTEIDGAGDANSNGARDAFMIGTVHS